MPKKQSLQDLSTDELRWLLMQKRRQARQDRLDRFRRSGRVVRVTSDIETPVLESWRNGMLLDDEDLLGSPPRSPGKRVLDAFLLLIELGAVVGLIWIVFSGLSVIRELNQEVATVLELPTLTPTPLIVPVVLPSGHLPPNSPGGARFNEGEIPEHLRPMVQSLLNIPVPTPGPEQAIRIQIPAIRVDAPVVQGDGWDQLKKGVGQRAGTVNPGLKGNLVLSAHNDIFGEIFRDLDQLKNGDSVIVFTSLRAYTYVVVDSQIVTPDTVSVMDPTSQPTVTLISCYPYMKDNQRIVIVTRLQSEQ